MTDTTSSGGADIGKVIWTFPDGSTVDLGDDDGGSSVREPRRPRPPQRPPAAAAQEVPVKEDLVAVGTVHDPRES